MFDKEAIEELSSGTGIYQAGNAIKQAFAENKAAIALPEKFKLHDLEPYQANRRRARGVMTTHALSDFATYTKTHAEAGASVFVDADEMSATAVLNLGTSDHPGHADNRAKVQLKRTAAYAALKAHASGQAISQLKAAEFLEDWPGYVQCFNDQGAITLPKAIAAIRKLSIESMRKLESSEQSLSASKSAFESVQATSAEPIPTTIYFDCEPYYGLESRQFVLRLGVLTGGDKPAISLRIVKQELHDEEMANEFADLAREALGSALPVLIGAYASR
jgi:uncharacterized protein YfdQ (DUF2303 family)